MATFTVTEPTTGATLTFDTADPFGPKSPEDYFAREAALAAYWANLAAYENALRAERAAYVKAAYDRVYKLHHRYPYRADAAATEAADRAADQFDRDNRHRFIPNEY